MGGWWPIATVTATVRSRAHGKRGRGSQRRRENEGRLWASPWRREDVGEAATAKQEVEARARARQHASASRQRLKTAVPLVVGLHSVGPVGRQVSFCSFLFFMFLLLISFATVLNLNKFKQCQKLL